MGAWLWADTTPENERVKVLDAYGREDTWEYLGSGAYREGWGFGDYVCKRSNGEFNDAGSVDNEREFGMWTNTPEARELVARVIAFNQFTNELIVERVMQIAWDRSRVPEVEALADKLYQVWMSEAADDLHWGNVGFTRDGRMVTIDFSHTYQYEYEWGCDCGCQ